MASCNADWQRLEQGVGKVRIPYYVEISGRAYWRPTAAMRAEGFALVRLGKPGPSAWKLAAEWNERWQRHRRGESAAPLVYANADSRGGAAESAVVYPAGSIGEAFAAYRRTDAWGKDKKPRTREDWWRGWKRIKPFFADLPPSSLTLSDLSGWRSLMEERHGVREAHRAMKIWRALWKVMAALQYCAREADPSLAVRNTAAKGRSAVWREGEVVRLVKTAWRQGYHGLAVGMAILWDSQLSPVDVRNLNAAQVTRRGELRAFMTDRAKTGAIVGGVLSRRTVALMEAYLGNATPIPTMPLIRSRGFVPSERGGRPRAPARYTKDLMAGDFAAVRLAAFGPDETRQLQDFRRSGAVEAIHGGATAEQLSQTMGNTLAASNELFATYAPHDLTTARGVQGARQAGRRKLVNENGE